MNEAQKSVTVAKALYYYDVRGVGPLVPPFDDIPMLTKLRYFDQAETVLAELELLVE